MAPISYTSAVDELPERVNRLRAIAGEHLPGDASEAEVFARIVCDRCGLSLRLDPDTGGPFNPLIMMGEWRREDGEDICPTCIAEGR